VLGKVLLQLAHSIFGRDPRDFTSTDRHHHTYTDGYDIRQSIIYQLTAQNWQVITLPEEKTPFA
jgi:hypothetical protein